MLIIWCSRNALSWSSSNADPPSITQQPQNDSILTDESYTLDITIDGAPFPDVVWNKDGEVINYTSNVFISGYDASLMFTSVVNDDDGIYSVLLSNINGSIESVNITLDVTGKLSNLQSLSL